MRGPPVNHRNGRFNTEGEDTVFTRQAAGRALRGTLVVGILTATAAGAAGASAPERAGDRTGTPDIDEDAVLRWGQNFTVNGGAFFDPAKFNTNAASRGWMDLIYDTMIHKTESGLEPGLATEWEVIDDSTFQLTLREGVTFQDGAAFDAEAVKLSWERMRDDPDGTKLPELAALESVDVVSEFVVQVNLGAPLVYGWFERFLIEANSGLGVVSPLAIESGEDINAAPVGAGPFKLVSYTTDQEIVLERNEDYWNREEILVAGVTIVQTATGSPTVTGLASGQLDIAPLSTRDVQSVEAQNGLAVFSQPSDYVMILMACSASEPLSDQAAREAVAASVNRADVNQVAFGGHGLVNPLPLAHSDPLYAAEVEGSVPEFDPDSATELVEASGLSGTTLSFAYAMSFPELEPGATVIQEQLRAVGIETELEPVTQVADFLASNDPDLWLMLLRPNSLGSVYAPDGVINACNSEWPEILESYNAYRDLTLPEGEQATLAAEYQALSIAGADFVHVADKADFVGMSDAVQGAAYITQNNVGIRLEGVYLEDD